MNIRKLAVATLIRIYEEGAYSNLEVKTVLRRKDIKTEDKGLYLNIVYGVLQRQLYLDYILQQVVKKNIQKLDRIVLEILRTAVYQLYFLDRVPDYAVVNEAVKLTAGMLPRARGFVNGVLRNVLRQKEHIGQIDPKQFKNEKEALSIESSIPLWIIHKYVESYGKDKAEAIIKQINQEPPFTIRVNTLKISKEDFKHKLETNAIDVVEGRINKEALMIKKVNAFAENIEENLLFKQGYFVIQDQGAMLTVTFLDPKPGERILDMCAAPGGKTTHISQLMDNTGTVIARDIFDSRIQLIENAANRLGITNIQTEISDGCRYNPEEVNMYDRILLDAPCSGLGIIRRKPEIRYGMDKEARRKIREIQQQLLENAVRYLKPGGTMVYSTCTVGRDENEEQIEKILEKHPEIELDTSIGKNGMLHTSLLDDQCDAFFMARLVKKSC